MLESKNYRHHLNVEVNKHKETQKDLNNALALINKLENQLLAREKLNSQSGGLARLPIKSLHKSMPLITNKALENHANAVNVDEDYRDDFEPESKPQNDSPDTDSEILVSFLCLKIFFNEAELVFFFIF